ncbi:MAG: hypothetical protein WA687_12750 [Solirubrobacterales bacterium]
MRSHAKASTAGSNQRQAKGLGGIFRGAIATRGASLTAKGGSAPKTRRTVTSIFAFVASLVVMAAIAPLASAAAPTVSATWSQNVVRTDAVLKAEVNPEGLATTYRFEWGTTTGYGNQSPQIAVGSDSSLHTVSRLLEGLQPGTTYHYRVVATNGDGATPGPDRTLTTYEPLVPETNCPNQTLRIGASATLPDCRAYEMVSPVDKNGAEVVPGLSGGNYFPGVEQSALDGGKLAYTSEKSFADAENNLLFNQFIATRGAAGWSTDAINPLHEGDAVFNEPSYHLVYQTGTYGGFTEDLSTGFLFDDGLPPLTPDALSGYANYYLVDTLTGARTALTTQLYSPTPLKIMSGVSFMGFSEDGSHTLFVAPAQLTPDAAPGQPYQIYDYHNGQLELVSILPNGEPAVNENSLGAAGNSSNVPFQRGNTRHAISEDGSRIFWTGALNGTFGDSGTIYARIDGETTVPVSGSVPSGNKATYWGASTDGSKVIFATNLFGTGNGDLYRFDVDSETPSLIAGEVTQMKGVLGVSDDASRVYFLSREALAAGATAGQPNLYLDQEGSKTFIATLTETDQSGPEDYGVANSKTVPNDFSQVTPDGRHLFFQSQASLTGYDNTSLDTGDPAIEIYRYDALSEELSCISCNPSGSRPQTSALLQPHRRPLLGIGSDGPFAANIQAAAWLPTPRRGTHMPRMIAEDGSHVFFNAFDPLVPHDSNGAQDVYRWQAQGTGGCQEQGGCIELISSGSSEEDSIFIDASEGGRDVFFRTKESIDPDDPGLFDIYDARIGGGFARPIPPPPCVGDSCQNVMPGPNDPTPASASYRGAGDPKPVKARNCGAQARRAAKLSRQAKLLGQKAEQADSPKRAAALRKRSAAFAKKAKDAGKGATRCRRASRRAGR